MKDIELWQLLAEPHAEQEERLLALLGVLAQESLVVRAPFWGRIEACVASDNPLVRAAATAVLAGVSGTSGWRMLTQLLDDDDYRVRAAAVDAIRQSAAGEADRWVHVLFCPRHDVRERALTTAGTDLPVRMAVLLAADPEHGGIVRARLPEWVSHGEDTGHVLSFLDDGLLSPVEAREALASLLSKIGPRQLLAWVPWARSLPPEEATITRIDELVTIDTADALDRVFDLFWDQEESFFASLRVSYYEFVVVDDEERRVAMAAARIGRARGTWTRRTLSLVAAAFPGVLSDPSLEMSLRKSAARSLVEMGGGWTLPDPLAPLGDDSVLFLADRTVDLPVVRGLLSRASHNPFRLLCIHFEKADLTAAFRTFPKDGALLLKEPPLHRDRKTYRRLLTTLTMGDEPPTEELLAHLIVHLPAEWLRFFELIAEHRPSSLLDLARTLVERELSGAATMSDRRRHRVAEGLGKPMAKRILLGFLRVVTGIPAAEDSLLAMQLLFEVAYAVEPSQFVATVLRLEQRELHRFIDIIAQVALFPLPTFNAVVPALTTHDDIGIRSQARARLLPSKHNREALRAASGSDHSRPLTVNEARAICDAADDAALKVALEPVYLRPVTGLCAALADRRLPARPNVEVCAALLICHDTPELVCDEFVRFSPSSTRHWPSVDPSDFYRELDQIMADRCAASDGISWLGCAWLYVWERRLFQFGDRVLEHYGGFPKLLRTIAEWPSSVLREQVWLAVALRLRKWRFRDHAQLLHHATSELGHLVVDSLREHQRAGASLLVAMYEAGVDPVVMSELRDRVIGLLGDLEPDTVQTLSRWFDTSGAPPPAFKKVHASTDGPTDAFETIHAAKAAEALRPWLSHGAEKVVRAALERADSLGDEGQRAVIEVLSAPIAPPHPRILSSAIADWPEGGTLEAARALVSDDDRLPELRYAVGVVLLGRGERAIWPAVANAVCAATEIVWFIRNDWLRLLDLGLSEREVALAVATSPQWAAYSRAVTMLVKDPDAQACDALRAFLAADSNRLAMLRLNAARALAAVGDMTGFPLLFSYELVGKEDDPERISSIFSQGPSELVASGTRALEIGGSGLVSAIGLLAALDVGGVDADAREQAWVSLLKNIDLASARAWILSRLRPSESRATKVRHLADTFAWGVRQGQRWLSRLFTFKMLSSDAMGYTRLRGSTIHLTPLPILRGERNGLAVMRGLIAHELGHHMYHADEEGFRVTEEAHAAKLARLLNLVQDEHLERNIRARSEDLGNDLKSLAAYAFQHAAREVPVQLLLDRLRTRAFAVLSGSRLGVARQPDSVRVHIGQALRELEAGASSFSRFMRALRMGLGDRFNDPRVAEGLALFRGARFRNSTNQELWELTKKLHDIFGQEVELLDLFDTHEVCAGEGEEVVILGEGISDDEVQREVDRILNPRQRREGQPQVRVINRSGEERFERITTVVPVAADPVAHRRRARRVARGARRLRAYLERLGLRMEPVKLRVRGSTIDRGRLIPAVVRSDPRMLVARESRWRTDLFLGVLVDCSSSMQVDENIEKARLFGTLLAEASRGLRGIETRFWGFTHEQIFDAGDAERCAVASLEAEGGNNDAAALWHASRVALRSKRKARLLVMISDGSPTECSTAALGALVRELSNRAHIACAQIAVRPLDDVCFPHYVEVSDGDVDAAVRRFGTVVARLVGKTLGA